MEWEDWIYRVQEIAYRWEVPFDIDDPRHRDVFETSDTDPETHVNDMER